MNQLRKEKTTGDKIKMVLLIAAVLTVLLYIVNRVILYNAFDRSYPEITFEQEVLEVSVADAEDKILAGVSASDKKDGDVTDTLLIESISKMLESGERIVTYAAFDEDNHVGKAERRIRYTDYTAPRFSLEEPLQMKSMSSRTSDILSPLKAMDCIDGDVTDQVIVVNTEISSLSTEAIEAFYTVQVTNSCGDMAQLRLPVAFQLSTESHMGVKGEIVLTDYLVYTQLGKTPDFTDYVESVKVGREEFGAGSLQIDTSKLDVSQSGVYSVTYNLQAENAYASIELLVVVEE